MKIKKGDTVIVVSGKDRGRKGKVLRALPMEQRIVVEGINIHKKHIKPKRSGEHGQTVEITVPIHVSNAKILCPKCGKAARVGYLLDENKKSRVCKKCGGEIS